MASLCIASGNDCKHHDSPAFPCSSLLGLETGKAPEMMNLIIWVLFINFIFSCREEVAVSQAGTWTRLFKFLTLLWGVLCGELWFLQYLLFVIRSSKHDSYRSAGSLRRWKLYLVFYLPKENTDDERKHYQVWGEGDRQRAFKTRDMLLQAKEVLQR